MNPLILIFTALLSALPIGMPEVTEDAVLHDNKVCITAEKIIKPTANWKVLATELKYQNGKPILEINVHNPLNKSTPQSVDAKFIFIVDQNTEEAGKYKLVMAYFYNNKTNVVFRRIYAVQEIKDKHKRKKLITPTLCFNRQVLQVIIPDATKQQSVVPDGGTD